MSRNLTIGTASHLTIISIFDNMMRYLPSSAITEFLSSGLLAGCLIRI
jgi:hypothetical protein